MTHFQFSSLYLLPLVAGPYCTMILSDLGADVIKIERPGSGDESRKWGPPFVQNSKDSVYFLANNRNKRSCCIDLKNGADVIHDLAKKCDVLVENYVPGKLDAYKLGYDHISAVNPSIVYCSITGYGSMGPYAQRPGYDVIAASIGGLLNITGPETGPPAKVGVAVTDLATGLYAHGAIMAALMQRSKTGRGQKIDVDLLSTQIASLINVGCNYLNSKKEGKRWGTAHESIVPYEAFKTKNGYLTVGTGSDAQFNALCNYLNISHIPDDPRFVNNQKRVENRAALIAILSEIFERETSGHWMDLFVHAPFPVGPINTIREVFDDPHVKHIGIVKTLHHPTGGDIKVVGPPVRYSDAANTARTAPPLLGQHTDEILRELLNYDEHKITQLREQKIIQ